MNTAAVPPNRASRRVVVPARQVGDLSDGAIERGERRQILHRPARATSTACWQFVADQRAELLDPAAPCRR